jgi:hypothetical protein
VRRTVHDSPELRKGMKQETSAQPLRGNPGFRNI